MISAFHHLSTRLVRAALAICLGFCLIFSQFASEVNAAKTFMTGDFEKDTISDSTTLTESEKNFQNFENNQRLEYKQNQNLMIQKNIESQ